jgi:DNA-binding response OmpR family regulator
MSDDPKPSDAGPGSTEEGPSVLLVEDDDGLREAIRAALSSRNFRIDTARTVAEALRHVLTRTYQVVVTGLRPPDVDGLELARLLCRRIRSPRIILLSETSDPERLEEALVAGASRVFSKPLSLTVLAREVGDLAAVVP